MTPVIRPADTAGRPSPAALAMLDAEDAALDATPAAQEHRLSGRWADAEHSAFPKFTVWRLSAFVSRKSLASRIVAAGFRHDATDLIRRIEDTGQAPTITFLAALVRASADMSDIRDIEGRILFRPHLDRDAALALFTVNGKPIL